MSPLYNVHLDERECVDEREVWFEGQTIESVIEGIRDAAKGLTDPRVEIDHDDDPYGGFTHYRLTVSGHRKMTDREVEQETAKRQRERRFQDHMQSFRG